MSPAATSAPPPIRALHPSREGEPVWELADLFYPRQGEWTESEYLALGDNRLIEFTDGFLEFLPMPKPSHGWITRYLSDLLREYVDARRLGEVFWAPVRVRLRSGRIRQPDIFYVSRQRRIDPNDAVDGADMAIELVSSDPKDVERDYERKRIEYAEAGIPEYWIVDPQTETITVLTLPAGTTAYAVHGEFRAGQQATSVLLPGFAVDVAACFAAGRGEQR